MFYRPVCSPSQNIGFDIRGDIKIFDFGLAKELKPSELKGLDKYRTSGMAGTRRYMAPEVVQIKPYGLSTDVFSFGILMWEMLALKAPFENLTREMHYKEVVVQGKRPKISKHWPFVTKKLLKSCWHRLPEERPSFQAVCELIKCSLPSHVNANERSDELMLRSIRSTHGQIDENSHDDMEHVPEYASRMDYTPSETFSDSLSPSTRARAYRRRRRASV